MANKLIYPSINPLQMFVPDLVRDERYNGKDFEDFNFPETILPWDEMTSFCQQWQTNDIIQLHLQTNIGPINFKLVRYSDNIVIDTIQFDQKQESETDPGLFIYECAVPLSGYNEDCYYVELEFGGGIFILRSGELNFSVLQENTLLLEYKHYEFRENVIFETGFFPSVRVSGTKKFDRPKQKSTTYEDQVLNMSALRSVKYRTWVLVIGGSYGIPDYFADMIGGIIGCSDFIIDGKYYTIDKDSELEPTEIENYPMRGWRINLRERYTRGARIYENDEPLDGEIAVLVNVDSKGFGNSNSGSETIIIDII